MRVASDQLAFDELGTPLRETTFVVFDLETTGTRPGADGITEIGAIKVRGGEVLGEFATLVDPGMPIPPQIVALTGITSAMVYDAPPITRVLPAFLEFAAGAVLVAHNAPFDTGFLRAACQEHGYPWPKPAVVCTVRLARRVLTRQDTPSHRLSALAALFGASATPNHRALQDARATVDVLHALLERLGPLGVHSLEELLDYLPEVTPAQRRKRGMAAHLPPRPGVYLFRGPSEEVLYVGTARDLRRRVRQYFTGSESRGRIREMVALAQRVDGIECAHALEAQFLVDRSHRGSVSPALGRPVGPGRCAGTVSLTGDRETRRGRARRRLPVTHLYATDLGEGTDRPAVRARRTGPLRRSLCRGAKRPGLRPGRPGSGRADRRQGRGAAAFRTAPPRRAHRGTTFRTGGPAP